jgi:two-component system chemotaxis response regulator CheB
MVMTVLAGLPADFPVPIVVVQHRPVRSDGHDALVGALGRRTPLTVQPAQAGRTALQPGVTVVRGGTTATIDTDGRWILKPSNRDQWPGDAMLISSAAIAPTSR